MCNDSARLIAWLDRELPASEAAEVERHLRGCSECRDELEEYQRTSAAFDAYFDAAIASNVRRRIPRWAVVASAAGAVAAVVTLFLALRRTPVEPPAVHTAQIAVAASPAAVAKAFPAPARPLRTIDRRHVVTPAQNQNADFAPPQSSDAYNLPEEGAIQIAIPGDSMFLPGAVPEGINFVGDVTIAADGSAERVRLRPQLAGFERSTTEP